MLRNILSFVSHVFKTAIECVRTPQWVQWLISIQWEEVEKLFLNDVGHIFG